MTTNYYTIHLYRDEDISIVLNAVVDAQIDSLAMISSIGKCTTIEFTLDYLDYSVKNSIEDHFTDYEFTKNLGNGRKEIRIKYSMSQDPLSTDGWGRPLEYFEDETIYLIKKSKKKEELLITRAIGVLFDDEIHYYYINTVNGKNRETNEKGFLLKKSFGKDDYKNDEIELDKSKLFKTRLDAFHTAKRWIEDQAKEDYEKYKKEKKRKQRKKKN